MLSRGWRRVIRAAVAVLGAIGGGTLVFPDYVPTLWAHNIQQTDQWIVGIFLLINPFLDLGADDAKGDVQKNA